MLTVSEIVCFARWTGSGWPTVKTALLTLISGHRPVAPVHYAAAVCWCSLELFPALSLLGADMRRREFLGLVGGTAAWPFTVRARHQAPVLRLQPAAPVRRRVVADIGDGKISCAQWRRHTPAHHGHLAADVRVANHRRRIVREHTGHRRQVAYIPVQHAEQACYRSLIRGDRIEIMPTSA
jgi:hypothetical protein